MSDSLPMNANDLIERQLDERARALQDALKSDFISFKGAIVGGADDYIRDFVESLHKNKEKGERLTVMVTTPGGYIEVVHRIVETLRHHYDIVNFVVPNYAYSAGTVLVMSGNNIYMDYYSRLGPIDPQLEKEEGKRVPALGYLIQWERLLNKAKSGELTLAELQLMIRGFDQAELYQYEQERKLSIAFLEEWLAQYKFKDWTITQSRRKRVTQKMRKRRAVEIATALNDTERWHTHGHGISMEVLRRDLNLLIDDFGQDTRLNENIKSYYRLFDDYVAKLAHPGALHMTGRFLPLMWEE